MAIKCPTFNSGQSVSKNSHNWTNAAILLIIDGVPFTQKEKILAFWAVSNLLAVGFLGSVFKHVVGRARPNLGALADRSSASFPSGHSLLAMALVCTILIVLAYLHVEKPKASKFSYSLI